MPLRKIVPSTYSAGSAAESSGSPAGVAPVGPRSRRARLLSRKTTEKFGYEIAGVIHRRKKKLTRAAQEFLKLIAPAADAGRSAA